MKSEGWSGGGRIHYTDCVDIAYKRGRVSTPRAAIPPQEPQLTRLAQPEASLVMAEKNPPRSHVLPLLLHNDMYMTDCFVGLPCCIYGIHMWYLSCACEHQFT